jgi:hypothetical protein
MLAAGQHVIKNIIGYARGLETIVESRKARWNVAVVLD